MSLGENRVRADFNPSKMTVVDQIKRKAAELIDLCEQIKDVPPQSERNRCASLAQTAFEEGAMWAVKAATYE